MTEFYLHYLWLTKQITLLSCSVSEGSEIEIIDFGSYNAYSSGPDFSNAKIRIDDLIWYGCVEMHVKASDWYNHNHHIDLAYNTVILHVVFDNNRPVTLNGRELPTVELKNKVDSQHYKWYLNNFVQKNGFNCNNMVEIGDTNLLHEVWEKAALKRQLVKLKRHQNLSSKLESPELLYRLIARSFGGNINQLPFDELTSYLPLEMLLIRRPAERYKMICLTSGLKEFDTINQSDIFTGHFKPNHYVQNQSWKRKGQRFNSHPTVRVHQFAKVVAMWDEVFKIDWTNLDSLLFQWRQLFARINAVMECHIPVLSFSFQNHILINAIGPFLLSIYPLKGEMLVYDWLKQIPPEKNKKVKAWESILQFPKNALHTQGCLQYFDDFCKQHACLSCSLGKKILYVGNSENNLLF